MPLESNPQLHLLEWTACWVPGSRLDSLGGVFGAPEGGALLPASGSLQASEGGEGSSGAGEADAAALDELRRTMRGMDPSQLRAMVGLPAPPGAQQYGSSSSSGGSGGEDADLAAAAGAAGMAAEPAGLAATAEEEAEAAAAVGGGVRQYEPEAGELVVLLSAKVSGKPALGVETLVVAQQEGGATVLELPDGWEELMAAA